MDAIIDELVLTVHSAGSTRLPPEEIRAIVNACVTAMARAKTQDDSRRDDVNPRSAYARQIRGS